MLSLYMLKNANNTSGPCIINRFEFRNYLIRCKKNVNKRKEENDSSIQYSSSVDTSRTKRQFGLGPCLKSN